MLDLVRPGDFGKTSLLFDMHRLRKRVFMDELGWPVTATADGLEIDEFDDENALYLLSINDAKRVVGTWRMHPTSTQTMIQKLWPEFLKTISMELSPKVWEMSRFAASSPTLTGREAIKESQKAVAEMFSGLTQLCMQSGVRTVFTLYDDRIVRVIRRLGCIPQAISEQRLIDGRPCQVASFKTDKAMLSSIRRCTGFNDEIQFEQLLPTACLTREGAHHVYA